MIVGFRSKLANDVYDGEENKHTRQFPKELHLKARRLLDQLNSAPSLEFMRIPPGNRLEKLAGDLKDFWSLRINDQWRIIFRWHAENVSEVDIVDYH